MAIAPFVVQTSDPADNDIVSQFPTNERANRDIIYSYLNVDHDFNTGFHNQVTLNDLASDPGQTGNAYIYNNAGVLNFQPGAAVKRRLISYIVAVKHLFPQAAVPIGWVLDTDVNDSLIRVNSTAGAGVGGSWTISGASVAGHALTINEMPSHDHTFPPFVSGANSTEAASGGGKSAFQTGSNSDTGFTGGGAAHTHGWSNDGLWRPAYLDVVKGHLA